MRIPPIQIPRNIEEVDEPGLGRDRVRRVATARVAFANHKLLARDFPGLRGRGAAAGVRREQWLLNNAGIMSVTQAAQTAVNAPIELTGRVRRVWRPFTYGRAVIVPVTDPSGTPGLLDVKGAGVPPGRVPSFHHHSSGLCMLREAFRELLFQLAIDRAFAEAGTRFWTLPVYGVIDLGFDGKTRRDESIPAGIMVRRAHRRPLSGSSFPWSGSQEERLHLEIELLLRHYGITSAQRAGRIRVERKGGELVVTSPFETSAMPPAFRDIHESFFPDAELPREYEALNIQLTRSEPHRSVRAQLVDFGHFEMRPRFEHALIGCVYGGTMWWGAKLLPGERGFVQPHKALCYPEERWGVDEARTLGGTLFDRTLTARPWLWTDQLAKDVRAGRTTSAGVWKALQDFVG